MRISVLGAGSWGTTLAIVLCENFRDVTLWSYRADQTDEMREVRTNNDYLPGITLPAHLKITHDVEEAASKKDLIVTAVPSQFLRNVLKDIAHLNLNKTIIVNPPVAPTTEPNR